MEGLPGGAAHRVAEAAGGACKAAPDFFVGVFFLFFLNGQNGVGEGGGRSADVRGGDGTQALLQPSAIGDGDDGGGSADGEDTAQLPQTVGRRWWPTGRSAVLLVSHRAAVQRAGGGRGRGATGALAGAGAVLG
jgi:hypothetical protein